MSVLKVKIIIVVIIIENTIIIENRGNGKSTYNKTK